MEKLKFFLCSKNCLRKLQGEIIPVDIWIKSLLNLQQTFIKSTEAVILNC